MMLMDIAHHMGDGPRDPINLLIFASFLREDMPWVYELGLEAYRAIKSGKVKEARVAHRKFIDVIEAIRHTPFIEESGMDRKLMHMISESFAMIDIAPEPQNNRSANKKELDSN